MVSDILITGATGNVGREVVQTLQDVSVAHRIAAHNPDKASVEFGHDANIVWFDFLKPATFAEAFADIKHLFLVRPPQLSDVADEIAPAIDAAKDAGVEHIVFLSLQGVENNKITPHYKIEQLIRNSGMAYTFLRAGFFMQNLSTTHRDEIWHDDKIAVPVGNAKTSFIDVRDIGAVAAQALIDETHHNQCYTLTGSEALTYFEVATILSKVLGREIIYTNPSIPSFFLRTWGNNNTIGYAAVLTMLYTITRFGNAAKVSLDVRDILGRNPITFEQFAQDYRHMWID